MTTRSLCPDCGAQLRYPQAPCPRLVERIASEAAGLVPVSVPFTPEQLERIAAIDQALHEARTEVTPERVTYWMAAWEDAATWSPEEDNEEEETHVDHD